MEVAEVSRRTLVATGGGGAGWGAGKILLSPSFLWFWCHTEHLICGPVGARDPCAFVVLRFSNYFCDSLVFFY